VGKRPVAIGALLGAIAGAAVGAYVQKLWASEPTDEDDFGRRLAKLEAEIEELEFRQRARRRRVASASLHRRGGLKHLRPRPLPEVRDKSPEQQYLVLTADRDFRLSRIDNVSNQGTTVTSENGVETESVVPGVIQQKYLQIGLARTLFRNVTLPPSAARDLPAL